MSKISVIMPIYNTKQEYLRDALQSILKQTFTDFEFLIIDNGSESYIKDIINSYHDERIKYLRIENNVGPANARNLALKQAQSPYIAFLDSDDIAYPERLQKQYDFLEMNPEIGCLGTKVKNIGDLADKAYFPTPTKHKDIELWLLFNGNVFCQSSIMLRKQLLDKHHLQYNTDYVPTEDYALWLDFIGLTKFAVLEDCLGEYRFYAENISYKQKKIQYQKGDKARMNALDKYLKLDGFKQDIFNKFLLEQNLTPTEIQYVNSVLPQIIKKLTDKKYSNQDIFKLFHNHFRKLFLHTRTIFGQWLLLTSPLNSYFGIMLHRRVFYFFIRGLFSITKRSIK